MVKSKKKYIIYSHKRTGKKIQYRYQSPREETREAHG
jgi:hypothetical protein